MSKRARITLNPNLETQSDHGPAAGIPPEITHRDRGAEPPRGQATVTTAAKARGPGHLAKLVIIGLAVAAVVLLLRGRTP